MLNLIYAYHKKTIWDLFSDVMNSIWKVIPIYYG